MSWNDFNTATDQHTLDLIPRNTLAKVRLSIKPGGYNNITQGLTGGYATKSPTTGTIYLNTEYIVLEGPYAKRRIWGQIGIHSEKSDMYGQRGHAFIKAALESAHDIHPQDQSEAAQAIRRIVGFGVLQGIAFCARIDVRNNQNNQPKNDINFVITPDHKDYASIMTASPSAFPAFDTTVPIWGQ